MYKSEEDSKAQEEEFDTESGEIAHFRVACKVPSPNDAPRPVVDYRNNGLVQGMVNFAIPPQVSAFLPTNPPP